MSGAGELGHRLLRADVVDKPLPIGGGRRESRPGGVVERPRDSIGVAVQPRGGIVGDDLVGPAGFSEPRELQDWTSRVSESMSGGMTDRPRNKLSVHGVQSRDRLA